MTFVSSLGVCDVCGASFEVRPSGRIRVTCSAACRQRRSRQRRSIRVYWQSRSDEWYTPVDLFQRIEAQHGPFDLDPATCLEAPIYGLIPNGFTAADDGLAREWFGRVFLNPPFTKRGLPRWVAKVLGEIAACRVSRVVLLVPARTDTAWWWSLVDAGASVEFLRGRVVFEGPAQEGGNAAAFPSAVLVLSRNGHETSSAESR